MEAWPRQAPRGLPRLAPPNTADLEAAVRWADAGTLILSQIKSMIYVFTRINRDNETRVFTLSRCYDRHNLIS